MSAGFFNTGGGNYEPKPIKYLFIDGNYFQKTVEELSKRIDDNIVIPIDYNIMGKNYERIIYYDSLPTKKRNQTDGEFEKQFSKKQDFLNEIRLHPKYHVRDGYTRMRPRATGGVEQKGVDTWLAIEVMQFAYKNTIDVAEIITGDLDLYPLFEALLQTKVRGVLHYHKGHTSQELIMSADIAYPITTKKLFSWAESSFHKEHFPNVNSAKMIEDSMEPLSTYENKYGKKCQVRYNGSIWQANFTGIGNTITAKHKLLFIDEINNFGFSIPDTAFEDQ
jgi:uncharacterized LabA/DUF88 family protein